MTKTTALKTFFSTEEKPVTNQELLDFRKASVAGYDEIAELCLQALGEQLTKAP